ncbi:MAG: TVP38/TMEM64 family protein [Acidobacteria bacterium]|nr:TVP38/TMEM64 family protein [Acidobacteriota bacterium]
MTRWISITAGLIVAAAIAVLLVLGPTAGNVQNLQNVLQSYGPWAIAISAGLTVAQAVIAPLPGNVITITNGLVFGPLWGSLLSWLSTLLGASICFLLSRMLGKPFALKVVGRPLKGAEQFFRQYGLQAVFVARIMPFVPFDAISYGAGLVGVPFTRFLIATGIGIIPSVLVYSYIGSMIAGVYWWVLITLLTVSLLSIIIASRFFRKREKPQSSVATSQTVA